MVQPQILLPGEKQKTQYKDGRHNSAALRSVQALKQTESKVENHTGRQTDIELQAATKSKNNRMVLPESKA